LAGKTVDSPGTTFSEMAQEIVSQKPGFMEKWALFIFLGMLLILLAATWFIRYPDFIQARATLTAENAPKELIPIQSGRLVKLFARDKSKVKKGDILGWIESTADHAEVLRLSHRLDSSIGLLNIGHGEKVALLFNGHYDNLGEVQQQYQSFITALQVFKDYLVNGFYSRKRVLLEQDISSLATASRTIRDQQEMTTKDVALAQETYNMNKLLFDEKLSSREEFRQEESRLLSKKLAVPQLEAAIQANLDQARDKLKEIVQLDHDQAQQETLFSQALHSLKSTVDDWKLRHILQSPVDGSVSFIIHLQENQFLQAGTLIGYISPGDAYYYTEAYLPQGNFGKIDTGLKVQLRFDAYPYQEAGFVEGTLDNLSSVASDSGILATIRLDKGLRTNNHRIIAYRSGLKAEAIVITKQMRLLQRLWYNINKSTSLQGK